MGRQLTNFEESIKGAAEDLELPYDSSSWDKLESRLDVAANASSTNYMSVLLAGAGVAAIISSALFVSLSNAGSEGSMAGRTIKIEKNTKYQAISSKGEVFALEASFKDNVAVYAGTDDDLSSDKITDASADADKSLITDKNTNQDVVSNKSQDGSAKMVDPGDKDNEAGAIADNNSSEENLGQKKFDIAELAPDEVAFAADIHEGCQGIEIVFDLMTEELEGSYLWNFGDGHFSSARMPKHIYNKSGTFSISLSVTSHTDGLIRSKTIEDMIVINPKPEADFEYEFVNQVTNVPTVKFINKSSKANDSSWSFDGNEESKEINPEMQYVKKGRHAVKLTAINEFGCSDSKYKYISIDHDYELLAPKTFSPGKAAGRRSFMPEALKLDNFDFKLTIYDAKQPIFESTSKRKPWAGLLPDSTLASPGDYPWVVIIYNTKGEEEQYYSGTITITP